MSEQKEEAPKKLTKEEVEARKAEMTAWHKEQIPFLEIQFKYEDLITKIQVAHTDRLEAEYKWIQLKTAMMGSLQEESTKNNENIHKTPQPDTELVQSEEGAPKDQTIHRTLKRD